MLLGLVSQILVGCWSLLFVTELQFVDNFI